MKVKIKCGDRVLFREQTELRIDQHKQVTDNKVVGFVHDRMWSGHYGWQKCDDESRRWVGYIFADENLHTYDLSHTVESKRVGFYASEDAAIEAVFDARKKKATE